MRWLAVAVITCAFAAPSHAGPCGQTHFSAHVITPPGTALPADGGVVVGATGNLGNAGETVDGRHETWRFRDVGKELEPMITQLAPGLVLYQAPANASSTELTLVGDNARDLVTVKRITEKAPAKLTAPSIKKVRRTVIRGRANYNDHVSVIVDLAKDPPASALALILFSKGSARSWISTDMLDEHSLSVFDTPGKCRGMAPGYTESKVGDKVTFAWVDALGRLSKMSNAFTVVKGK